MIGRLVGTVAVIATVFLPVASHAQGVPGGVERGARDVKGRLVLLEQLLEA
jgi:hypothetical protein